MAPVGRDGPPRRPGPSLRGVAVFYTLAGKPVVRKWPRARGKARTQVEQQRRDWFARANRAWRYVWSGEQHTAQRVTAGSPLQPRDLHLMAWSGRLFRISFKDGTQMVSQATRMGVSESLDALEHKDGDVLTKVGEVWKGTTPAAGAAFKGARADFSFSASDTGAWKIVPLTASGVDTGNVGFDPANNRFVMPAGITLIRCSLALVRTSGSSLNNQWTVWKNGARLYPAAGGFAAHGNPDGYSNTGNSALTGPIPVAEGDVIDLRRHFGGGLGFDGTFTLEAIG